MRVLSENLLHQFLQRSSRYAMRVEGKPAHCELVTFTVDSGRDNPYDCDVAAVFHAVHDSYSPVADYQFAKCNQPRTQRCATLLGFRLELLERCEHVPLLGAIELGD